jgi:uncharacterized RDD family membrane protein YckC
MEGTQPPERPPSPQAPAPGPTPGPQAPPPGYTPVPGGDAPPGGWEQPIARPSGWEGRPLASWGSRVGAQLIDWIILLIPGAILTAVVVGAALNDDSSWWAIVGAAALSVAIFAALSLLYAPLLMMRSGARNGQTLGKQMIGITVVRDNGQPLGFGYSALREVVVKNLAVGIASAIIPLIPWFLDNFWPLWDDQNRALHDMAVQTHVVRV